MPLIMNESVFGIEYMHAIWLQKTLFVVTAIAYTSDTKAGLE